MRKGQLSCLPIESSDGHMQTPGLGVFSNRCQTGKRPFCRFRISALFCLNKKISHVVTISGSSDFGMAGDLSLLQASKVKPPPREKYAGLKGLGDEWFATPRGSDQARFTAWRFDMYLRYSGLPSATIPPPPP
jgi:hypothetical protein